MAWRSKARGHKTPVCRLIENKDASGVQAADAEKPQRILSFLQDMEREDELRTVPAWKAHLLTGSRKGMESVCDQELAPHFCIDRAEIEITDVDYEDYH